jgi:hypothetical protein
MRQIALPQGLSVSRSLAKVPVFADWRDIANLAYWVTGTEGSNPSLSAIKWFSPKGFVTRQNEGFQKHFRSRFLVGLTLG